MQHRILIVDDDKIFNSLLSDVFRQAGYLIDAAASVDEAVELLGQNEVDLVVTDNRMPGTSGTEFVRSLLDTHKGLPVVMVSGFLSNEEIRQLIHYGIGGIFIKPLNIFQLLKRAAMLIERSKSGPKKQDSEGREQNAGTEAAGNFISFRGARSVVASRFFKQLESLKGFTSNLLLVGNPGTNFETLCHDLSTPETDTVFFISPSELDDARQMASRLAGLATQEQGRLTLVLDNIEELTKDRAETIFGISRGNGPFNSLGKPVRFIFCLHDNLDELFDAGKIDENLYLFMGTMELKVPSLEDLAEDIPSIAQEMLNRSQNGLCRLDEAAAAALRDMDWPGGTKQLEQVLVSAASVTGGDWIDAQTVSDAYEGKLAAEVSFMEDDGSLKAHLVHARSHYISALMNLFASDTSTVAKALGISPDKLQQLNAAN